MRIYWRKEADNYEIYSEAIDFRAASEYRKLTTSDFETLRLLVPYQGHQVPSVGGLLLFGRDHERETRFPDAWIQCGRFRGRDRSDIVDQIDCKGNLLKIAVEAIQFIAKHSQTSVEITRLKRIDTTNIPEVATREAVMNAVVHADYSQSGSPIRVAYYDDRIEIENPGVLPIGITIEDILSGVSKLRNRVIGRVFRELGYIEQWGSGIRRMINACFERGLPSPVFEEVGTHFRVNIWLDATKPAQYDEVDKTILQLIGNSNDGLSTSEVSHALNKSSRATRLRLRALVDRGLLVAVGRNANDPGRRYFVKTRR